MNTPTYSLPAFPKLLKRLLAASVLAVCSITAQAVPITITGTVTDDGDGGTISGTPISSVEGNQLYVYLMDNNNVIIDRATVSATTFTYSLTAQSNQNYSVSLSTAVYAINASNPVLGLPVSWAPTAEGTTSVGDGVPDLMVVINSSSNLTINFAIDARPEGNSYVISNMTFDGNGRVILPAAAFTGSDLEDGTYSAGFNGRKVDLYQATGGSLYYNGSLITFSSAASATRISNFDVNLLRFQPQQSGVRQFAFSVVDNAGVPEAVPNSILLAGPALPVSFGAFRGRVVGTGNFLQWETKSEHNCREYIVERSTDGNSFREIATMASRAKDGNSAAPLSYEYTDADANPQPKGVFYYRIRQLSNDGTHSYSNVVRLANSYSQEPMLSIAPNPAKGIVGIDIASGTTENAKAELMIYNSTGTVVYSRSLALQSGRLSTSIDLSGFSQGNYFVRMSAGNLAPITRPLVVMP